MKSRLPDGGKDCVGVTRSFAADKLGSQDAGVSTSSTTLWEGFEVNTTSIKEASGRQTNTMTQKADRRTVNEKQTDAVAEYLRSHGIKPGSDRWQAMLNSKHIQSLANRK